jgi:hypothetical protein
VDCFGAESKQLALFAYTHACATLLVMKQQHSAPGWQTAMQLGIFIVLVGAAVGVVLYHGHADKPAAASKAAAAQPPFSFVTAQALDWRKGPSNQTSLAVFHNGTDGCFASMEYRPGAINTDAALQATQASLASSGYTSKPGAVLNLTLQTDTGQQQYQLHQYAVSGTGSSGQTMGGQEFGYLQLSSGYLKIESYCNTPEQLSTTMPALQAMSFDATRVSHD